MEGYALRLDEDRLEAGGRLELPARVRILYVWTGEATITTAGGDVRTGENGAWHGAGACRVAAGPGGATLLRYELVRSGAPAAIPAGATSRRLLEHAIALDPGGEYLMRCDRVDFAPGGVALPHRHQGGGIRCLIAGGIEVRVEGEPPRSVRPGEAWFESGREPVLATADAAAATSFIRVSILPRAIRGQSSIMYVDAADAWRGRPRQYTVFVDEPIELP
jgi:quercetin dioxygenase-like cupin family protein